MQHDHWCNGHSEDDLCVSPPETHGPVTIWLAQTAHGPEVALDSGPFPSLSLRDALELGLGLVRHAFLGWIDRPGGH